MESSVGKNQLSVGEIFLGENVENYLLILPLSLYCFEAVDFCAYILNLEFLIVNLYSRNE